MFNKVRGAKILSEPDAVIQMPNRRYPALAVQGDTLGGWALRIDRIVSLAKQSGNTELIANCEELKRQIMAHVERYDRICREEGGTGLMLGLDS